MSHALSPHAGAVFGPAEVATLSTAYEVALASIREDDGLSAKRALALRRALAFWIIAEARSGNLDPEHLKNAALTATIVAG